MKIYRWPLASRVSKCSATVSPILVNWYVNFCGLIWRPNWDCRIPNEIFCPVRPVIKSLKSFMLPVYYFASCLDPIRRGWVWKRSLSERWNLLPWSWNQQIHVCLCSWMGGHNMRNGLVPYTHGNLLTNRTMIFVLNARAKPMCQTMTAVRNKAAITAKQTYCLDDNDSSNIDSKITIKIHWKMWIYIMHKLNKFVGVASLCSWWENINFIICQSGTLNTNQSSNQVLSFEMNKRFTFKYIHGASQSLILRQSWIEAGLV